MRVLRPKVLILTLFCLLPLMILLGTMSGPVLISPLEILQVVTSFQDENGPTQNALIIEAIRLPRVFLAALIGMLLATCGAVLQGLFRNPLADPTLIGVSAGASVGASLVIVLSTTSLGLGIGLPLTAVGAFSGGLITSLLVYKLATGSQGTSVATMLLAGIAISAMAAAINNLLSFFADNEMLRRLSLWQMGNLDSASWDRVLICLFVATILLVYLPRDSRALNAILLGESQARHLGVNVENLKRRLIILSALGVGVSIAVAGNIVFLGLVIPHLVRLLIGPDHRYLLPASALAGATLLILADTLARVIVAPAEIPAGVITAILGAPFFVSLLVQQRKKYD